MQSWLQKNYWDCIETTCAKHLRQVQAYMKCYIACRRNDMRLRRDWSGIQRLCISGKCKHTWSATSHAGVTICCEAIEAVHKGYLALPRGVQSSRSTKSTGFYRVWANSAEAEDAKVLCFKWFCNECFAWPKRLPLFFPSESTIWLEF